jgi:demethylmenaquinone methyltransferase / 2-methoxy-6-polyprenyl-1,4-benzoquinol methylase
VTLVNEELERAFDDNALSYDRVNRIISFGLDSRWRRWAAREAVWRSGARVLDAFAGTGMVGLEASALGARVTLADASPGMLEVAERRARERGLDIEVVRADLASPDLPFAPVGFDAVTIVFGVRYLGEPAEVLRRLGGLLVPGGRLVIVEFVVPRPSLVSALASHYFFNIIPKIAPLLGGRSRLHDTLAQTTRALGTAHSLVTIVEDAGLEVITRRSMGFGMVAGIVCRVPGESEQPAGESVDW